MKLTDIHCHMLPFVDDGPDSVMEAKALLAESYEQGVRRIIVTPHYRPEMFETPIKRIRYSYSRMKEIAAEMGIRMRLGCEFYRNEHLVSLLRERERPSLAGSRYVLIEFSTNDLFQTIHNSVYELLTNGYKPVIAHIERYACCGEIEKIQELRALGASIQINAGAVLGNAGRHTRRYCKKLMQADLIDFIASDTHDTKNRRPNLGECAAFVEKKMGKEYAFRIFVTNPGKIWNFEKRVKK